MGVVQVSTGWFPDTVGGDGGRRRALEVAGGPLIASDRCGVYERLVPGV